MRRQYMYIYVYVYVRRYYCCLDVKLVCADLDLRRIDVYLSCGMKALGDFRWGLDGLQHSRQKTRIPHRCFKGLWRTDAEQFQRKKHSISFSFAIYPRVNSQIFVKTMVSSENALLSLWFFHILRFQLVAHLKLCLSF